MLFQAELSTKRDALPTALIPLLLLPALACADAEFYEPSPPVLVAIHRAYQPPVREEPVVYGLIFDLEHASPTECQATKTWLTQTTRDAMLPSGRAGVSLPTQDLSPNCVQPPGRRIDLAALKSAIADAEAQFPGLHIKPVVLYLNNLPLPVPAALRSDLEQLRVQAKVSLTPQLWGVAHLDIIAWGLFDESVAWTASGDAAISSAIASLVERDLPYMTQLASTADVRPVLSAEELATIRQLKTCQLDSRATTQNLPKRGKLPIAVDPAKPPTFVVTLDEVSVVRHSAFVPQTVTLDVEGCVENCDRYLGPRPFHFVVWEQTPNCLAERA